MTPSSTDSELDPPRHVDPYRWPITRPFYASLSQFEREVLDSRTAELLRDQRMDYDPFA